MTQDVIQVLDVGQDEEGGFVLLDGHGAALGQTAWVTFGIDDIGKARNSRGELFAPNITHAHFTRREAEV